MEVMIPKKISNFLVYIAVLLIPFYFLRFDLRGIPTNPLEIAVGIAFIFTLITCLVQKKLKLGSIVLFFLLVIALLGAYLEGDRTAFGIFKGWFLVPFLLYFSVINNFEGKEIKKITGVLLASGTIVALWSILQKFGFVSLAFYQIGDPSFTQYLSQSRVFGPFESPNYLAMFLAPVLFLGLIDYLESGWFKRIALTVTSLIFLLSLYLTDSRAGILALAAGCLTLFIGYLAQASRGFISKTLPALLFVLISVGMLFFVIPKINLDSGSNMVRKEIYSYSLEMVKANPFTGVGVANFYDQINILSQDNPNFRLYGLPYAIHPHNVFLAFWLNFGILGLLAFILVLGDFFINIFNTRSGGLKKYFIAAAMVAILVHGLFDTTYFKNDLSAIFWLILALAILIKKEQKIVSSS